MAISHCKKEEEVNYREKKVLVALLDLAVQQFSNNGCNDFDLQEVLPQRADRQMLARDVAAADGDEDEVEWYEDNVERGSDFRYDNDAGLLAYFSEQLTNELAQMRTKIYEQLDKGLRATYSEDITRALFTIAMLLGYEEEENAWHLEMKPVAPEDELGMYLYQGLQTRIDGNKVYYLDQVRKYEGFEMPFEYTVPELRSGRGNT